MAFIGFFLPNSRMLVFEAAGWFRGSVERFGGLLIQGFY